MSDIVFGGWSDIWRTDLGYASVRSPDIRPPPRTISYTYHFLIGRPAVSYPPGIFNEQTCLRKRWRYAQFLADAFWKRWVRKYLPQLSLRKKWIEGSQSLKVGDIVIIADERHPRNLWLKGVIETVFSGKRYCDSVSDHTNQARKSYSADEEAVTLECH